ncbi:MAG: hypothetical protein ACOZDY_13380 [Pseudomonadota bacterium]
MNLEEKLRQWFERPEVRACNWEPRLFWEPDDDGRPFGRLRVDPWELEVLLATVLGETAENYEALNARVLEGDRHRALPRADFIAVNARRHELPLLTRIEDVPSGGG